MSRPAADAMHPQVLAGTSGSPDPSSGWRSPASSRASALSGACRYPW